MQTVFLAYPTDGSLSIEDQTVQYIALVVLFLMFNWMMFSWFDYFVDLMGL